MCVALVLLTLKPRLVIYNLTLDSLRPILADLVDRLDADARWAGDSLVLPALGVQLYVDSFSAMRSTSLVAAGGNQNPFGWRRLQRAFQDVLAREEVPRNPRGVSFIAIGLLLLAVIVLAVARDPQAAVRSVFDLLQSFWTPA